MTITRAIDVGHGNTKFTTADADADFNCMMFPSISPPGTKKFDVSNSIFAAGEMVQIEIDGANYMVGKDSETEASSNTRRMLDKEFSTTNVYLALVRGALYYMNQPKIDMLVLGLPLTTYETHREKLRERMVGGHKIPNPMRQRRPDAPEFISVELAAVRILPQPVGAFFNYSLPRNLYGAMSAQRNLILDVGHGTFDWFLAQGNQPIKSRSDGYSGGISKVIDSVADAIGAGKNNFAVMGLIDQGLRTNKPIEINGNEYNLVRDYGKVAANAIREAVGAMAHGVGDMSDVNNIILTGGGADLFYDEVVKALPGRKIIKDDNPIFSNVCGFQLVGEQWISERE
jgi:plasmid segregation protein ParM